MAATTSRMVERDDELGGWIVADAATATEVLRDPATWSSDHFDGPRPAGHAAWLAELSAAEPDIGELLAVAPQALVAIDPPDHGRLRGVLRSAFSPAAVDRLRPLIASEVDAALRPLLTGEPVDAVAGFTRPVPFRVVASLLGIERDAWPELEALAHAASTDDTAAEDRAALRERLLAEVAIARFFTARLGGAARTGEDPRVLPALRAAVAAGEVTVREAAGLCREVLVAGAESVGHHLSGALLELATAPAEADRLRTGDRDGELLSAFIERRLAVDPPFAGFWRRATRPVRLGGASIPQDGHVLLRYAAINAGAARHLSFGHGIHFCLGAGLARLESRVALAAILAATREIEPAGTPARLASKDVNGFRTLPLRLRASCSGHTH